MTVLAAGGSLSSADATVLFLSLGVLLAAARLMGEIVRKLGQPSVFGEILAGILLGPTLLGRYFPDTFHWLFPTDTGAKTALDGYLTIAVTLLLLVAGLELDLTTVLKRGTAALRVSVSGIALAFSVGFVLAFFLPDMLGRHPEARTLTFALFIGIALSITALPVIAKTLMDLNLLKSDIGMIIIAAAMIDDLTGWIGFAMVLALMHGPDAGPASATQPGVLVTGLSVLATIGLTLGFVAFMLVPARWVFHKLLPIIQARTTWPGGVLGFTLSIALLAAAATEWIGIHAIFGAFIAGIAIGDSAHLRERTRDLIFQFVTNIFAPVFFASIGLRVNFIDNFDLGLVLLVLAVALVTKIVGCSLGARWAGMNHRESLILAVGMSGKGTMEIILGQLAYQAGLITEELFVALVIMALTTSLFVGPVIQRLMRAKQQRKLSAMLGERTMILQLRATDAREAIRELADRAAQIVGIDPLVIDQAVWDREQMMRTGVGDGIAVPHARLTELDKPLVVLARSDPGIDFAAPDNQPARLIFLILTPAHDQTAQIELLSVIAKTFRLESTRELVQHAKGPTEVIAALNMAEQTPAH